MLILWMSSPLFLLQLPLISSAPIYIRLPEKSGNYCRSIQISSFPTVFSASTPNHGVFNNLPTVPGPPVFIKACCLKPRRSFSRWRKQVLFNVLLLHGPVLSTCCLNLMVPGDPLVISNALTQPPFLTDTLCLQKGSLQIPMGTFDIPKTAIITPLASLSFSAFLLASGMLLRRFIG